MSRQSLPLNDELYTYILSTSLREAPVLQRLRLETSELEMARMQIAPEQGQFMAFLVRLLSVAKAIEVGVFTGYSALSVALAMPENGHLIACDVNAEWTALARKFWYEAGVSEKIDLRLAPAVETLDALLQTGEAESFDLAFIDADKGNYLAYYQRCYQLLRPGGLMIVDNVLWGGAVADSRQQDEDTCAIRAFNDYVLQDQRVDISMIPVADGLTLVRKR